MITAPPAACRLMRTFSSPSVISISPMPDSCTRSISFFSWRRSTSGLVPGAGDLGRLQAAACRLQRELVAQGAEARDHADRQVGEIGMAPERLAGMHVGQMDLDEWNAHRCQGVPQCNA